jgi:Zn-dependent membrane protease YugP
MYFYVDWLWIILVLPAVVFSIIASAGVNSTFKKYSQVKSHFELTGHMAARRMLNENGLSDIQIERISGELTDHYDPKARAIRLSASTYDSKSPAAIGVATHEVGHAIQHAQNYFPIKVRQAIIPITNIGSKLAIP